MVINRVAPRRVGASGRHLFITHRRDGTVPRAFFSAGYPEVSVIALHFFSDAKQMSFFT
jgi:hypothetical protein